MSEFAVLGSLFAQTAEWTNKEVLTTIGSAIAATVTLVVAVAGFYVQHATRETRRRLEEADRERDKLKVERDKLKREQGDLIDEMNRIRLELVPLQTELSNVRHHLLNAQAMNEQLTTQNAQLQDQFASAKQKMQQLQQRGEAAAAKASELEKRNSLLQAEITQLRQDASIQIAELEQKLEAEQCKVGEAEALIAQLQAKIHHDHKRISKALKQPGQLWNRKVRANAPAFKKLDERRTPIISVLNLKGGVGKTTLTANLGAAFARMGHRPLLVDLDLQGSLSGLLLPGAEQTKRSEAGKLLENFLFAAFNAQYPHLVEGGFIAPIMDGQAGLVATSDVLVYAEANLLTRWLLRECPRDPRFLLRRELHLKQTTKNHGIILMDCPPLLNVSCISALAASDYLIIPVMPSNQATARIPPLLKRVREFRDHVNPDLKVLGVIANRTTQSKLTVEETNRLVRLAAFCKDAWGEPVTIFDNFVKGSVELRAAEDEYRPVDADSEMGAAFMAIANEIKSRVPAFCLNASFQPKEVLS